MNETSMSGMGETDTGGTLSSETDSQKIGKQFSDEKIREFEAFATSGNIYDKLVTSFAPSIWELDDVKRGESCCRPSLATLCDSEKVLKNLCNLCFSPTGVLCQLFGGTIDTARERMKKKQPVDFWDNLDEGADRLADDAAADGPNQEDNVVSQTRTACRQQDCGFDMTC